MNTLLSYRIHLTPAGRALSKCLSISRCFVNKYVSFSVLPVYIKLPTMLSVEKQTGLTSNEQFVLLAKSAKGPAVVELIKQVLSAPGIYVFGELLTMPTVQEVSTSCL